MRGSDEQWAHLLGCLHLDLCRWVFIFCLHLLGIPLNRNLLYKYTVSDVHLHMINYYSRCAILASREIPAVVNVINYYSRCAILASDKINKSVQALREIKIPTAVPILAHDLVTRCS